MSLLLHFVFVYSVFLHTIDGASVAQTDNGYQTFTSQRNVRKDTHSITEVATGFLDEVPSKLHISQGWQKAKNMAEMVANKTYHVLNGLVMSSSVINKDNNGDPTKNTSTPLEKTSTLSNSSNQTLRESSLAPVSVKSIDADKCEESPDLNCLNWKILKTVGASIGAGFVLGIFSPVLFYFIIVTIGGFGYGNIDKTLNLGINHNANPNLDILRCDLYAVSYCLSVQDWKRNC